MIFSIEAAALNGTEQHDTQIAVQASHAVCMRLQGTRESRGQDRYAMPVRGGESAVAHGRDVCMHAAAGAAFSVRLPSRSGEPATPPLHDRAETLPT